MYKKALFFGIALAFAVAPLSASASTIDDLQAQIANLIAQIQMLQSGQASTSVGVSGSGSVSVGSPGMVAAPCSIGNRSLHRGENGDDVASLQEFLTNQGYFSGVASGYFGAQTETALGKWQADNDIAVRGDAGWGIFGPHSRTHYRDWCGNRQSFRADPQSGPAPLTTTFTTSDSIAASSTYSVDFGDGQNAQMTKGSCIAITAIRGGQGGIRCSYTVGHTYAQNGTYTAKLLKQRVWSCPNGMMCAAMMPAPQVVGTLTITVGAQTNQTLSAQPTSGAAPLSVTFSVPGLPAGGYWAINFGDGQSQSLLTGPVTHTYAQAGTYTATALSDAPCFHTTPSCMMPQQTYGSAAITVTGTSTNPNDQQIYAPASVTLTTGGIAEVRNKSFYFTLTSLTSAAATIQITPVGCWNAFPSDPQPRIVCMIAIMPIPPATLSLGQAYSMGNYTITLTSLTATNATFSVN